MGSTHQNLLHPGEWNFKCENQDDSSTEGDGQAPDEVHHNIEKADLWANSCDEKIYRYNSTHIIGICEDGESKHGEDFHVDEVAAVSEPGEGSKCRPGEEIVHRTSIALACD